MNTFLPLLAALVLAPAALADSQVYRWTDKDGVRHYGGTPPQGTKYDVLRGSGAPAASSPAGNGAAGAAEGAASTPGIDAATQRFLDESERKNKAQAEAQAKASAEQAAAAQKCSEARERHQFLQERTARRLVATNDQGELERMNQEEFLKRLGEAQQAIDENCR